MLLVRKFSPRDIFFHHVVSHGKSVGAGPISKLEKIKAMEFQDNDREEEGTEAETDINYNITVKNAFESLRSDPEEPPEVTPETIVKLRPDYTLTPSTPTTTEMDEMDKFFLHDLSMWQKKCYLPSYHKPPTPSQ